jgi:hypothetical protein
MTTYIPAPPPATTTFEGRQAGKLRYERGNPDEIVNGTSHGVNEIKLSMPKRTIYSGG